MGVIQNSVLGVIGSTAAAGKVFGDDIKDKKAIDIAAKEEAGKLQPKQVMVTKENDDEPVSEQERADAYKEAVNDRVKENKNVLSDMGQRVERARNKLGSASSNKQGFDMGMYMMANSIAQSQKDTKEEQQKQYKIRIGR